MSLKELASTMSAQGRGPDDVLVHMSSKELAGLQGLALAAGGSLTVNPSTGLPEAGFLDSLLPTILGIGAMFIPGMQPLGAAAIGAGSKAVLDPNASLMDIALAGLGGYGGAQLGAGLAGVGSSAAQAAATPLAQTAGQTALQQAAQQSGAAIGQGLQAAGSQGLSAGLGEGLSLTQGLTGAPGLAASPSAIGTNLAASSAAPMNYQQILSPLELEGVRNQAMGDVYMGAADGFKNLPFTDKFGQSTQALMQEGGLGQFTREMGGTMPTLKAAGMAAAPGMLYTPEMTEPEGEGEIPRYRYSAEYTGGTRLPDSAYTSERQYFTQPTFTKLAKGGKVDEDPAKGMSGASASAMKYLMGQAPASTPAVGGGPGAGINPGAVVNTGSFMSPRTSTTSTGTYMYDPRTQSFSKRGAEAEGQTTGGLFNLRDFALDPMGAVARMSTAQLRGTYAKGGVVDLKKGGFVVPADVVSALGNGSSEAGLEMLAKRYGAKPIKGKGDGQSDSIPAKIDRKQPAAVARDEAYLGPAQVKKAGGAKKLYAMMDNIRTQAHGKKQQQRPVNPRAALA
jgi:hypothetical protein